MAESLSDDTDPLALLRGQYEHYPYPHRDPEDERRTIRYTHIDTFACLNHYGFSGRRDFSRGFRVLVAGGGTGDSTIVLAEQLRDTGARVVHLDLSAASIEVAKRRAEVRGLDNIDWVHGSLLDVAGLGLGTFDYINCSGVLHHLESPEDGLAALVSVLEEDGLLGIMLYGKHGRADLYRMQALMRLLAGGEPDMQRRVDLCGSILEGNSVRWISELRQRFLSDAGSPRAARDVEIYDLFLHSRDRPYTVDDVYELLDGAGLHLLHFFGDCIQFAGEGNRRYRPETYSDEPQFLQRVAGLQRRQREAVAELLHSDIGTHLFYAARSPRQPPPLDDPDSIPFLAQFISGDSYRSLYELVRAAPLHGQVRCRVLNDVRISFRKTENVADIFRYLDGRRTLGEIFRLVRDRHPPKRRPAHARLLEEFRAVFEAFNLQDCMFLRHASAGAAPYRFFDLLGGPRRP